MSLTASEFRHRHIALGGDALASQHRKYRKREDAQIQQEATILNMAGVSAEFLLPADGVASGDLCQAGDPRTHLVAARLLGCVTIEVPHRQWSGSDQAHVSAKHIA